MQTSSLKARRTQVNRAPGPLGYDPAPVFHCTLQSCSAGALAGGLFVLVYLVSAAAAALHALLTKPDPRSVISWIALCWLFPLGGSILYWLFGINRVATSGRSHEARTNRPGFGPAASSMASNSAQIRSRRDANQAVAWGFSASCAGGCEKSLMREPHTALREGHPLLKFSGVPAMRVPEQFARQETRWLKRRYTRWVTERRPGVIF